MDFRNDERALIQQIRAEATNVKNCFTNFSFQAMTFSAALISIMFGALDKFPLVVLTAIPLISYLMIICRIGIYISTGCCRNLGHLFHLAGSRFSLYSPW